MKDNIGACITSHIFEWSRPRTFIGAKDVKKGKEAREEFEGWKSPFVQQIGKQFVVKYDSKAEKEARLGHGSRSMRRDVSLVNDEAANLETTNSSRLSRKHWEDMLRMQDGESVYIYFRADKDLLENRFASKPTAANAAQVAAKLAEKRTKIGGIEFVQVKATISDARTHLEACSGRTSLEQLQSQFHNNTGYFVVDLCKTDMKLTFSWREMLELSDDVLFFGPPIIGARKFKQSLKWKNIRKVDHANHLFRELARETFGDGWTSSALYRAYLELIVDIQTRELETKKQIDELLSFDEVIGKETNKQGKLVNMNLTDRFFSVFDCRCKRLFRSTVIGHSDHNQGIMPMEQFDFFVWLAPQFMPRLWKHLCNLRNVKAVGEKKASKKELLIVRKRQVLLQIFALRRMRNPRILKWWSMIQATGYYGWGVGRTALDATNYWGVTASSLTRDRCLAEITENLPDQQALFLGREAAGSFTIDNYMKSLKLRTQRNQKGTAQLSGTMEMSHKVFRFSDTTWDGKHVELDYTPDQPIPSPVLMPAYNDPAVVALEPSDFYKNHKEIPQSESPDFTGGRVKEYSKRMKTSKWIHVFSQAFGSEELAENELFKDAPENLDRDKLISFAGKMDKDAVRQCLSNVKSFQRESVRRWNPTVDEVSLNNYIGLAAMNEDKSPETGSLVLDLAMKWA